MTSIWSLRKKLDEKIKEYDKRLKYLECEHNITALEHSWMFGVEYSTRCSKCGKFFRYLSEQEYLEISIKNNKEQCASDRKELEERLAKLKEESDE